MTTKSQYDFSQTNIPNYQILITYYKLLNYYNKYKLMLSRKKRQEEELRKIQKQFTKQYLKNVYEGIKQYSIPFLIHMIVKNNQIQWLLFNLSKFVSETLQQQQKQILYIGAKILYVVNKILPTFNILQTEGHIYYKIVNESQILPKIEETNKQQFNKMPQSFITIFLFVAEFITYKNSKDDQIKLKQIIMKLKQYQLYQIHYSTNLNTYQQIAINWMKKQLNSFQKYKDCMCCKTSFYEGQNIQNYQYKSEYFENKGIVKINQKSKQGDQQKMMELARIMCTFLNTNGGVILVAFDQRIDATMMNNQLKTVKGVPLNFKQKLVILNHIKSCADFIQPKHKYLKNQEVQKQQIKIKFQQKVLHAINFYINVQFMPIFNLQTFEYSKYKKQNINYICKIYIKMGHPRYFYYVIENNKLETQSFYPIRFYDRKDNIKQANTLSDKGKTIQSAYEAIYGKLFQYENNIKNNFMPERKQIHTNCVLDNSMSWEIYDLHIVTDDD